MKNLITRSLLLAAGLCTGANSFAAPQSMDIRPLADARGELKPTPYTAEDRELMAKQALLFIKDLYVHRELKIKDFGAQVDPVPRLEDMVRRAGSMNDVDFQKAMQKIFLDLHDHHTNYVAPMPLRCSYALAPVFFTDVYDGGSLKVIVKGKTRALERVAAGDVRQVTIGDELISINDKPISSVLDELKLLSGGANEDAMVTGAIMNLSIIPLAEQPVPEINDLKYTFKRGAQTFSVSTRYYAALNIPSCVESVQGNGLTGSPKKPKKPRKPTAQPRHLFHGVSEEDLLRAENPVIRDYKNLVLPEVVAPFAEEGKLPVGSFYTIDTPAGKLAKLDLETFVPEGDASGDDVIHQIKSLLQKTQPSATALIIDMRSNGGGLITLAEGLTQLFTPNTIEAMPVRFLPNDLNLATFLNSNQGRENGWSQATRDGIASRSRYTKPRAITSTDAANRYGQVWFKPVVILTDANCYSACDLFAAAMQDHAAATIIGTHASTGAGGANVMDYDIFRRIFQAGSPNNNPFLRLPGSQGMRVSWRQTLRVGKNQGQLIEDAGVKSDIVVRYVSEDVVGGESRALMREVHKAINKIIPRYKSNITLTSGLMMKNGASAAWSEQVKGVDLVEVVRDGQVVESFDVDPSGADVRIDLTNVKADWSEAPFYVVGKLQGVTQFRVVREIRWRGNMLNASSEITENFNAGLRSWHTIQTAGPAGEGWQVRGGSLRIGKGATYTPNTISQVFATIDTDGKTSVELDLALRMQTESGMDFVNIIVRDPVTGDEEYLASLSGTYNIAPQDKISIPVRGAKQLEIVFEFMSDENWNLKGPEITKLGVQTL